MDASGDLRVGDRERAETDTRLRAAHDEGLLTLVEYDERSRDCFAARFRRDLDALVVDLPADTAAPTAAPAPGPTPPPEPASGQVPAERDHARRGRHGRRGIVVPLVLAAAAVFVGSGLLGADQGVAIFGSRTVTASSGTVEVGVLYGSTTVVVPDGTRVTTGGTILFGSTDCEQACSPTLPPGAPQVTVSGVGAFGSVDVETVGEAARGGIDRDDDRDD